MIDLHYRDYEEPPGNGGFLLNGGRIYIDMGHLEYSSPECRTVEDSVAYDLAGDQLLQSGLEALGVSDEISFIKNNVDHHTGATFGCHENYLMKRELQFSPRLLGTLLSFLATRQLFTGAGRVGQASPLAFDFEPTPNVGAVQFQLKPARGSHRQRHLSVGCSSTARSSTRATSRSRIIANIGGCICSSATRICHPFATAPQSRHDGAHSHAARGRQPAGGRLPARCGDGHAANFARRHRSRIGATPKTVRTRSALDIQREFLNHAQKALGKRDAETDWILESWAFTLDALATKPELLLWRRRLDFQEVAFGNISRERGTDLGRPMVAKPRPRIPQHQSRQGSLLRADPGERHRRI